MSHKRRVALRALVDELARAHPELRNPTERIVAGDVRVDGVVRADAIALVKPQFELGLPQLPHSAKQLAEVVRRARKAFASGRWSVQATIESPARGARGAVEFLLHARRS